VAKRLGRKLGKKKLGKTLVAVTAGKGRVSGAIWRADMETSTGAAQTRTGFAIRSGYFAVIAIILIVAVALCWGLTHI
jgi:hypothetical protein